MNPFPTPQSKAASSPSAQAPGIQNGPTPDPAAPTALPKPTGQVDPYTAYYNSLPASTRAYMHAPGSAGQQYANQQTAQSQADFGGMNTGQQFDAALANRTSYQQPPRPAPAAPAPTYAGSGGAPAPMSQPTYTAPVALPKPGNPMGGPGQYGGGMGGSYNPGAPISPSNKPDLSGIGMGQGGPYRVPHGEEVHPGFGQGNSSAQMDYPHLQPRSGQPQMFPGIQSGMGYGGTSPVQLPQGVMQNMMAAYDPRTMQAPQMPSGMGYAGTSPVALPKPGAAPGGSGVVNALMRRFRPDRWY